MSHPSTDLLPIDHAAAIVKLEQALALVEARVVGDIPAAKLIRDQAEAENQYARRRGGLRGMQISAEIKLRAERVIGEMLAERVSRGRPKKVT